MKKIILYGNSEFSKLIKYYFEADTKRKIEAVTVDREYIKDNEFENIPVIPFEEVENYYSPSKYEILVAIGYSNMNTLRKKIFEKCKAKGYSIASFIHSSVLMAENVKLGEGNIILENSIIQPFAKIGNGNLIWHNVSIAHDCEIGNFNTITGMSSINGANKIGNNCFLGSNSTIKDHLVIANYSLIGAGTYISKDTEEYGVYVPNRAIKLEKNSLEIKI